MLTFALIVGLTSACPEQAAGSGLSFTGDAASPTLVYVGPMESDIGRFWPMSVRASPRRLSVRIGPRSIPTDPGGASLPAFGPNGGSVKLPALQVGMELVLQQGRRRATWRVEVTDGGVVLRPVGVPVAELAFVSERWFFPCSDPDGGTPDGGVPDAGFSGR